MNSAVSAIEKLCRHASRWLLLAVVTVLGTFSAQAQPFAYVANDNHTVSVIDTATNTITATVPLSGSAYALAITPDGAFAYVTNEIPNVVSVISTSSRTVVATIPVGSSPFGVAVSPDGGLIYVTNLFSNTLSVIRAATNTVIATIPMLSRPYEVAVTPDGQSVYVTNDTSRSVSVVDASSGAVIATLFVGGFPQGVSITPAAATQPMDKGQCKNGGWRQFTRPSFRNQGECVSFVERMKSAAP